MTPVLHFADRALLGVRVLLLDDARHVAAPRRARCGRSRSGPSSIDGQHRRSRSRQPSPTSRAQRFRLRPAARRRRAPARGDRRARRAWPASPHDRCRAARPAAPSCRSVRGEGRAHLLAAMAVARRGRRRRLQAGARCRARARSSGRPASGCSTFGRSEFMRLPWPAARMTTESRHQGVPWQASMPILSPLARVEREQVQALTPRALPDLSHCSKVTR